MEWRDKTVLEAASWRLASELVRRHPSTVRLIRGHPGGGHSDCLWIGGADWEDGDIRLNRWGTIQVLKRFDGRPVDGWGPVEWDAYLRADPHTFLHELEAAAGLPAPFKVPASTPTTLTYRILAAIVSTAVKSVHPMDVQSGFVDTSGPNEALETFTQIPDQLLDPRDDDLLGIPGYRFWIVVRDQDPVLAFEQLEGVAWTRHHDPPFSLMKLYEESRHHLLVTALKLFRRVDQV